MLLLAMRLPVLQNLAFDSCHQSFTFRSGFDILSVSDTKMTNRLHFLNFCWLISLFSHVLIFFLRSSQSHEHSKHLKQLRVSIKTATKLLLRLPFLRRRLYDLLITSLLMKVIEIGCVFTK